MTKVYIPAAGWYTLDDSGPTGPTGPIGPTGSTGATGPTPPIDPTAVQVPVNAWEIGWSTQWQMPCESVVVFAVPVPAGLSGLFRFYANEYQPPTATRELVLSTIPGSFDMSTAITRAVPGTSVSITWDAASLPVGVVYFNFRNWLNDAPSCVPGSVLSTMAGLTPHVG